MQRKVEGNSSPRRGDVVYPWGTELPLIGRSTEINALRLALDRAFDGRGHTVFLKGESGVGKTRLVQKIAAEARRRGFEVASGHAFSVESSLPYGVIADALVPPLSALDPSTLAVLARGVEGELRALLPGLPVSRAESPTPHTIDKDLKIRLFWNFAQFLQRLTARRPLLLVIENAHWCDPSSLELVHFLARQLHNLPLLLLVTYAADHPDTGNNLRSVEHSLTSLGEATARTIEPLTRYDLADLLQRVFEVDPNEAVRHSTTLHEHTAGNAFFVEETLKALLTSRQVRQVDGTWVVADVTELVPPSTVRDAVRSRIRALSDPAQRVAELAAVVGTRAPLDLLERVAGLGATALADAVDELVTRRILLETRDTTGTHYEFVHPIVQSTILGELSAVRERALHANIADDMMRTYGADAIAHASAIAVHLVRGQALGGDERTLQFLMRAGQDALEKRADREAVRWLTDALAMANQLGAGAADYDRRMLLEHLAIARERIGEDAVPLWQRALDLARTANDAVACSRILRRLGLIAVRSGSPSEALALLADAEAAARQATRTDLAIRVRVATAMTLQSLGRAEEGKATLRDILPTAEALGDHALLARVHRALLELHGWTGEGETARHHGAVALAHAKASGDEAVAWSTHWAMAVLEGFSGNSAEVDAHRREAERLAERLRSPVLQAWTAEIAIEYASAVGDWSEGLALAERTIPVARAIAARTLLPRLLVWTGLIVLARDEGERARDLFAEAWTLSRADDVVAAAESGAADVGQVHNVILAHTGMAAYHLSLGEWGRALEYGERGLALADRYGYVVWAIHRLLPIIAESALYLQKFDRVEEVAARLRAQSGPLGHRLGAAWAAATEALLLRFLHHSPDAAAGLLASADELEAVPFVFHAGRLRRNAAQLLEGDGEVEEAVRQLRRAHDLFARLGAEFELRGTRSQLRSLGVRLPPRGVQSGAGALTGRELEIARYVAKRLSNKEIGRALDISARTVSTHLSNIFEKLGIDSRGALADLVREDPKFAQPD